MQISIQPIEEASKQFEEASQQSQAMIDALQSIMSGLTSMYRAELFPRSVQDFELCLSTMTQQVRILHEISTDLDHIVAGFREMDKKE